MPYLQFFRSDVEVCGLNLAALLTNQYRAYGISIAPFAACNEVGGLEVKGFGAAERNLGFSIGIVSIFVENLGAMFGVVNLSGVDAGRSAGNSWGWQIGLYNHNENQGAVQIGLLNYNARAAIPWLPFFNLSSELADDVKAAAQAFRITVPGLDKPLIGEFDLLVQDGSDVCIVDWKTAACRWPAGKADRDFQSTVFCYAYEKQTGTAPLFRFDVITKTKNPSFESHYTCRGIHDFARFEVLANQAQRAMKRGVFLPNETSFACHECPYRNRCRQWHLTRWR